MRRVPPRGTLPGIQTAHQGEAFDGPQIGLQDDAGLAIDASTFDYVIVELVGFLLVDEGSHIG